MPTRKIIEKLAKKDPKAALSLSSIEFFTKSEEAALQSAKVISRYNGDAARDIAQGLMYVAWNTEDKNKIINAARMMSLDEILNAGIKTRFEELTQLAAYIEDKDAVIEAAKVISKYNGDTVRDIARGLRYVALDTEDKNKIINAARIMSLDEILNAGIKTGFGELTQLAAYIEDKDAVIEAAKVISKYNGNGDTAWDIAQGLSRVARNTEDKDAVIEATKVISKYNEDTARDIAWGLRYVAEKTEDKDAVIEATKVISKYNGDTVRDIARGLRYVALDTEDKNKIINAARIMSLDEILNAGIKTGFGELTQLAAYIEDKDAVIEAAKVISKYNGNGDTAWDIAQGLSRVARNTEDKDAVIEATKVISKYNEDTARDIAWGLRYVAEKTEDKDAVIEATKVISKYNGDTVRDIARGLRYVALDTEDKNKIINAARIMSLDEILSAGIKTGFEELTQLAAYIEDKDAVIEAAKVISRYKGDAARDIAWGLRYVAGKTEDKDAVIEATKVISKYNEDTARDIARGLSHVALYTEDKNKIINAARIMSLDEILNAGIKTRFEELTQLAAYIEDKDAVIEVAKVISRYKGDAARDIAWGLRDIAGKTEDKDAVIEVAKVISRYKGDTARDIAWGLRDIAMYGEGEGIRIACRIVDLVSADALDLLGAEDFVNIKKKRLEDLIDDKESFDAVAAYIKSGFELPAPNKANITSYKEIASNYLSNKYGINKSLNTNQILMLFSVNKDEREGLSDLINDSSETNLKTYSISAEETKRLEVDKGRLPYLSIIAVTGSRDDDLDNEAYELLSKIVGEKAIRKARNEFKSHYRLKLPEIAAYLKEGEIDGAINSLKATKNESIEDVLECADYRDVGFTKGKAVLSAVESNNPLDYDSRTQIACVYLPESYDEGIYNYCRDYYSKDRNSGFTLVRYNIGEKALGSAICYIENDKFLVDSVEGHRTFRKPQIFQAVYQDLMDRAREKGAKRVIFSEEGINETPKKFIEFLEGLGLKRDRVKMKLNTEGYLEAEKSGVNGYTVNLD
ncbi:MAG: hypothetical protein M1441_00165 [Candidatus Parvarchaeota archaeon]|nr:hypothetical protein [Candidatus Parvarchaeota archaeon]